MSKYCNWTIVGRTSLYLYRLLKLINIHSEQNRCNWDDVKRGSLLMLCRIRGGFVIIPMKLTV